MNDYITDLYPTGRLAVFGSDVLHILVSVAVESVCACILKARTQFVCAGVREAAAEGFSRDLSIQRVPVLLRSFLHRRIVRVAWPASQVVDGTVAHVFQAVPAAARSAARVHLLRLWLTACGLSDGLGGKSRWRVGACAQTVGLLSVRAAVQLAKLRVNRGWYGCRAAPPRVLMLGCGSLGSPRTAPG